MLQSLILSGVGPAPQMAMEPIAPRMNLIAGDNGLGKSFLLEVAWWALTSSWRDRPAQPSAGVRTAKLEWRTADAPVDVQHQAGFHFARREWQWPGQASTSTALALYAVVDGSFAVWDPARNLGPLPTGSRERPAFRFTPGQVLEGLSDGDKVLCNGLIRDWATWQGRSDPAFAMLCRVLDALAPSASERLEPGRLMRVSIDDVRDHPTLKTAYGQDVPVILASAAIRRVVSLAYLLVWTWTEHRLACELRRQEPARQIIFLIDEVEAHLHPHWQRKVLRALLAVMEALTGSPAPDVQLLAVTHSPLVLASAEPFFDPERDALWVLDLEGAEVKLRRDEHPRHGDANAWLTSDVFELDAPVSEELERALRAAKDLVKQAAPTAADVHRVDGLLRDARVDPYEPFLLRWRAFADEVLGRSP